ncbi:MAG: WD40/YVTN/BNR-like repeat-containing protein, partial [Limisphaerales bacterium]
TASAVSGGSVYFSDNSGQAWEAIGPSTASWQAGAMSADGTALFAAVNGGYIYFSTNFGSTWSTIGSAQTWLSIACSSDGTQLIGGTSAGYVYTYLGGVQQTLDHPGFPIASVASSANGSYLLAAGYGGDLYLSSNAGSSWAPVGSLGSAKWDAVALSADGGKMAAAVSNGTIYVSSNYGSSWQSHAPVRNWVSIASSSDGGKLVAVAQQGGIYTSSNWGNTWTLETNDNASATANWSCVASSASGNVLAAGINNTLASGVNGIYTSQAAAQTQTTVGTSGYISGSQGSAAELQCVGNNEWMPVSVCGTLWAR